MIPFKTLIKLDPSGKKAIYEQVAFTIINLIRDRKIQPGSKLPSTRMLAQMLSLHRKTIIAAYEELTSQGWIMAKNRSGYYVNADITVPTVYHKKSATSRFPSKSPVPINIQFQQDVSSNRKFENVFLDDGLPDPTIAPYKSLLRELKTVVDRKNNLKKVNHGTAGENSWLRDALASHLAGSRGLDLSARNIFITNGAQMGIYLIGKALISQGDVYIVGSPGYGLAKQSFIANGATVIEVPVDCNGIDINMVESICKRKVVKGIYVIPHHHYPTTVTLSPERRMKLIVLAQEYNFVIIEDDYDYDFHYSSAPHLPMASYNHNGRVIYIGSLSKCLSFSLRLGFIAGPDELIRGLAHFRKIIDIRGDILMERAVAALFENGEINRHIRKSNKLYKERRNYMCEQIDLHLSDFVSYQMPAGGMAIWMEFDKKYSVDKVGELLIRQGVSFNRNIIFSQGKGMNHIRLGFASLGYKEIDKSIRAIKSAIAGLV